MSYETAMLLKECGFDEICDGYYYSETVHNGRHISFEEELDLRAEGRDGEISEIKGGMLSTDKCRNSWDWVGDDVCAAPRHGLVKEWLRVEHGVYIDIPLFFTDDGRVEHGFIVRRIKDRDVFRSDSVYPEYTDAMEDAIVSALNRYAGGDDGDGEPDTPEVPAGTQWVHRKSGGVYTVVSGRARMKTSGGWADCVVYAPGYESEFEMFARPVPDFLAGFEMEDDAAGV